MKQRIYRSMKVLVLLTVLVFAAVWGVLSITLYNSQITGALSTLRVTVIDESGAVLYDNKSDSAAMENHLDRPEVAEAFRSGSGESTRVSDTLGETMRYYAMRTADGNVLRLAFATDGVFAFVRSFILLVLFCLAFAAVLAFFIARRLTKQLTSPINNINLDAPQLMEYDELLPLVRKIKEQKTEIAKQINAQRESEKQRREFSANVSHELKTPLTSISALSEMIATGMAKDEDIKGFAGRISEQAKRLIDIINDIIRLSEFDEGGVLTENTPFDLYELAQTVIDSLRENGKGVEIRLAGEHFTISANRRMIDELLYNLIDNGIKYNRDGGSVTVALSREDGMCKIEVSDTGIGIPAEHHSRVFERFYRVDKSRSKKSGGTGLGLSIVKHITEHHGGRVELKSAANGGTVMTCFISMNGASTPGT